MPLYTILKPVKEVPTSEGHQYGVVANVLNCDIVITEFELQLLFSVHFWSNTLGKGMNSLSSKQRFK